MAALAALAPDGAQADDAQGLAHQLRADEGRLALLHHLGHVHTVRHLLAYPLDAAQQVTGGQEQVSDEQFLDGVGVGARGVENRNATGVALVDGNVVGAGAARAMASSSSGKSKP